MYAGAFTLDSHAAVDDWLLRYRTAQAEFDPEFSRWLEEDYAPLAGGWHY